MGVCRDGSWLILLGRHLAATGVFEQHPSACTRRVIAVSEPALPSCTDGFLLSLPSLPPYQEQHIRNHNRVSGRAEGYPLVTTPMNTTRALETLTGHTWAWQYMTFTSFWRPSNITTLFPPEALCIHPSRHFHWTRRENSTRNLIAPPLLPIHSDISSFPPNCLTVDVDFELVEDCAGRNR